MSKFCARCERDKAFQENPESGEGCPIAANALAFDIDHPNYPKEWVKDAKGPRCTAFVEIWQEIPYRCPDTKDMFE